MGSFEDLVAEGVIGEVLARLQSGKEADVYVVRYGAKVCAAKVYKDRAHRSFKNNADYLEGRTVRNTRSQRAMGRKSRFGLGVAEDAWKASEADALYKLHAAGVRVPTPVMFLDGVLLMELVLDPNGAAAPRLIDIQLTERDANTAYHDMVRQLVRMLSCDLIHGDLSPYNVLWAPSGPTIIDFPQTISAAHNSNAERFFLRDARNILGHFASIDRSLNARSSDPGEIWRAYRTRELTPEFVPTGRRFAPRPPPAAVGPRGPFPRDVRPPLAPRAEQAPAERPAPPPRDVEPPVRAEPPRRDEAPLGQARDHRPNQGGHGPPQRRHDRPSHPRRDDVPLSPGDGHDQRPLGGPPPQRQDDRPRGGPPPQRQDDRPRGGPPPQRHDDRPRGGPPPQRHDDRPRGGPPPQRHDGAPRHARPPQGQAQSQSQSHEPRRPTTARRSMPVPEVIVRRSPRSDDEPVAPAPSVTTRDPGPLASGSGSSSGDAAGPARRRFRR